MKFTKEQREVLVGKFIDKLVELRDAIRTENDNEIVAILLSSTFSDENEIKEFVKNN